MQDLRTVRQRVTPLPPNSTHAVYYDQLHTLHQLDHCLCLHSETEQHDIYTSSFPVGLAVHNGVPLLATRAGELIVIEEGQVNVVGDVTHESPDKSGILAVRASSDGCLLIVVSPVSITVLDSEFEKLSEISIDHTATEADIAWRSDGEFFVVLYKSGRTHGIVVDRSCENIKPLDIGDLDLICSVTWESRVGGMICVPDHQGKLIFFERNGLRHIRSDYKAGDIKFARWNHGARILAVVDATGVTFWTRMNYYWYKKKRLSIESDVIDVLWDEDDVLCAHIITSDSLIDLHMSFQTSTVVNTNDGTHVAVIDGCKLMLTNISRGVVPPPMSHGIVEFDTPVDTVFDAKGMIGVLLCDGVVEVLQFSKPLSTPCVPSAPCFANVSKRKWALPLAEEQWLGVLSYRLPVMIESNVIALVKSLPADSDGSSDYVVVYRLDEGDASLITTYKCKGSVTTMSRSSTASLILSIGADSVVVLDVDIERNECTEIFRRQGCLRNEATTVVDMTILPHRELAVVHGKEGELEVIDFDANKILSISNECTSYTLHESFLVFTTRSHLLYCIWMSASALHTYGEEEDQKVPSIVDQLSAMENSNGDSWTRSQLAAGLGATRPIDRGSLIVTGIPGDVSIVLQVPRGNIETIAPRPLVFQAVHRCAKLGQFGNAFSLCRRQRVDMNHLVDADYDNFLKSTAVFVEQVGKAGHLSVFLSFLKGDQLRVNTICDSIVSAMSNDRNSKRFTTAILTGLVKREPPDLNRALELVRDARARSNEEGLAAVDYLFVLLKDEEKVYAHALGMYDLKLASFIAESSQMDPAEFSSELRELHHMNQNYRKYNIDMKLERYDSALRHLFACGGEKYEQCVSLTHEHHLYETALHLFDGDEDIVPSLLNGYGSYLEDTGNFDDAAAVFIQNGDLQHASICYQKGGRWQLAINAISRLALSDEEKHSMYDVISTGLAESSNMIDAAKVRATLMQDIDGALELLVIAEEWEAAFELLTLWKSSLASKDDMQDLWDRLVECVHEGYEALSSTLYENRSKLSERRNRLETLRESKQAIRERLGSRAPDEEAGSDVFSATTASSIASNLSDVTFTSKTSMTSLYTSLNQAGPLTTAKLEKQAEKRRRKAAKKRIREGHPREEEALIAYLRKLVPTNFLRERFNKTCRALLYVGRLTEVKNLVTEIKVYLRESLLLPDDVLPMGDKGDLDEVRWLGQSNLADVIHPNR